MKAKYITAIFFLTVLFSHSQSIKAVTIDGKKVLLNTDKTWDYISTDNSNSSTLVPEYPNRPYYLDNGKLISFEKTNLSYCRFSDISELEFH